MFKVVISVLFLGLVVPLQACEVINNTEFVVTLSQMSTSYKVGNGQVNIVKDLNPRESWEHSLVHVLTATINGKDRVISNLRENTIITFFVRESDGKLCIGRSYSQKPSVNEYLMSLA